MHKMAAASLQKLPTELVLRIAVYLAPCEAVSIGLTCHRLYGVVSESKTWAGLRATRRQAIALSRISTLRRTKTNDGYCWRCSEEICPVTSCVTPARSNIVFPALNRTARPRAPTWPI